MGKPGDAALLVLAALGRGSRFGFDIMDETGLKSGSVYRALSRLEALRLVESSWEDAEEALREKRPRRRYYRLTPKGREELTSARARLLVIAIDDPEKATRMVKRVRRRFPDLKLIVRAHSRSDAFEYHELGVPAVRETFGSALIAAEAALRALDHGPVAARRVVARFRRHDEDSLAEQAEHRDDIKKLISLSQRGRQDLEKLLTGEIGR